MITQFRDQTSSTSEHHQSFHHKHHAEVEARSLIVMYGCHQHCKGKSAEIVGQYLQDRNKPLMPIRKKINQTHVATTLLCKLWSESNQDQTRV